MKWVALASCLILLMPLSAWLREKPNQRLKLWTLLGFLPFIVDHYHLYMAVYSTPEWGGYVKGAELSGVDLVAITLLMSIPKNRHSLPFRLPMALYFAVVTISAVQALAPTESLFYSWQLARMFLLFATVAKGCEEIHVTRAVMRGMAIALMFEAVFACWQRFGENLLQTGGSLGHQNLLGLMSHLVILPFFAVLLGGASGLWAICATLAGAVIDISTASRGVVGISALGLATIFALSSFRRWTPRKARLLWACIAALVIVVPATIFSFAARFDAVPIDDDLYDERAAYQTAATEMLTDHPFGIGANSFAVIGNISHYYERAGVGAYALGRAGNVHNIYYLVAAETGYPGLLALLLLFATPLIVAIRCGLRNLHQERGDILLGLGVALFAVYIHSWVEWSLATFSAEYLLAIVMGLIAANARQLNYWAPQIAVADIALPKRSPAVFFKQVQR